MFTTSSVEGCATGAPQLAEFKQVQANSARHESGPILQLSEPEVEDAFGGDPRLDSASHREVVSGFPSPSLPDLIESYFQYITSPFSLLEADEEEISMIGPLRERDTKALAALFEREDVEAIAADVSQTLTQLSPEPGWGEDHRFDFLREYL